MSRRAGRAANPICTPGCELRPIPGFPDYFAGADGNLYSEKLGGLRLLSGGLSQPSPGNYYFTHRLRVDGAYITVFRHRMVALAFHGPLPEGKVTDHADGDGLNNRPENLRYVTPSENSSNPNSKPNYGKQLAAQFQRPEAVL